MQPHDEEQIRAIRALEHTVTKIRTTLNCPEGTPEASTASKPWSSSKEAELAIVKSDIQSIRDALTSHVAKEERGYEILKRLMNTGVSITGALSALLLAIIGYLLVHPVGL